MLGPRTGGGARLAKLLFQAFGIDSTEYTAVYTTDQARMLSDTVDVCCLLTGFTRGSPVLTIAVDAVLLARDDVDPVAVHDLVAALIENREPLIEHDHLLRGLSETFTENDFNYPLHAGAVMYLQRHAPTFFEKHSDLIALIFSIIVALAGAISALIKHNERKRKNRIDEYYVKVIEVERQIPMLSSEQERRAAVECLHEARRDAFDKLVHEKLAADESFRIFVTLVESAIAEFVTDVRQTRDLSVAGSRRNVERSM